MNMSTTQSTYEEEAKLRFSRGEILHPLSKVAMMLVVNARAYLALHNAPEKYGLSYRCPFSDDDIIAALVKDPIVQDYIKIYVIPGYIQQALKGKLPGTREEIAALRKRIYNLLEDEKSYSAIENFYDDHPSDETIELHFDEASYAMAATKFIVNISGHGSVMIDGIFYDFAPGFSFEYYKTHFSSEKYFRLSSTVDDGNQIDDAAIETALGYRTDDPRSEIIRQIPVNGVGLISEANTLHRGPFGVGNRPHYEFAADLSSAIKPILIEYMRSLSGPERDPFFSIPV